MTTKPDNRLTHALLTQAEQWEVDELRSTIVEREQLQGDGVDGYRTAREMAEDYLTRARKAEAEVERLTAWVNDLQSGMYVNCVYCGHRYGPESTTPVAMAGVLKAHIEQCPKHPMSALKARVEVLEAALRPFADFADEVEQAFTMPLPDAYTSPFGLPLGTHRAARAALTPPAGEPSPYDDWQGTGALTPPKGDGEKQ